MARLTEKYHLINTENGISVKYKEWEFIIVNFSNPKNFNLVNIYKKQRITFNKLINKILPIINLQLEISKNNTISNQNKKEINLLVKKYIIDILFLFNDIFTTVFQKGWDQLSDGTTFNKILPSINNADHMLTILTELLTCIDIAIYSGFKELNKNKEAIMFLSKEDNKNYDLSNMKTIGSA